MLLAEADIFLHEGGKAAAGGIFQIIAAKQNLSGILAYGDILILMRYRKQRAFLHIDHHSLQGKQLFNLPVHLLKLILQQLQKHCRTALLQKYLDILQRHSHFLQLGDDGKGIVLMIGIISVAILVDHDRLKEPDLIVMKQYMLFHPADFRKLSCCQIFLFLHIYILLLTVRLPYSL